MSVERPLRYPGFGDNLVDAGCLVPLPIERLRRSLKDAFVRKRVFHGGAHGEMRAKQAGLSRSFSGEREEDVRLCVVLQLYPKYLHEEQCADQRQYDCGRYPKAESSARSLAVLECPSIPSISHR